MPRITGEFLKLLSFTGASRELNNWISGAESFTLLVGAMDAGILDALRSENTIQKIAVATAMDEARVNNIFNALESHGLVKRDGEVLTLAPGIKNMMKDDAVQSLLPVVRAARVRLRTLRDISSLSEEYTDLCADDTLSMAQGIGIASLSPVRQSIGLLTGQAMPKLKKQWQRGARHLELGCGVGNSLFQMLTAFPNVTAKGIEINATIAKEAQRRAVALGLAARIEVVHGNAAALKDVDTYDTAHWSQFFFPESCRADVLRALFPAMKPGGYVYMPLLTTAAENIWGYRRSMSLLALRSLASTPSLAIPYINAVLTSSKRQQKAEKRLASIQKVIYEKWGVPIKTANELKSEVEQFGFRVLQAIQVPASQFSEARGWLLTERPKRRQW